MLPQFGLGEMVLIVLLAIIVVGPKDLPKLMRTLGGLMAKVRAMGQEFRDAFDEMDADDEIKALREEIAQMKSLGYLDDELDQEMRDLNDDLKSDLTRDLGTDLRDTPDQSSDKL